MMRALSQVVERSGTPCFVYDFDQVRQRVAALREAFGGRLKISYAVKANPNPAILRRMRGLVVLLDISSAGELRSAINCGWPADLLGFTGPGKREFELTAAVEARIGAIIVESPREAGVINELAGRIGLRQKVLIRIAPAKIPPGFGVSMAGRPCQFGIDEEDLDAALPRIKAMKNLDIEGFHCFAGTQSLKADAIAGAWETYIALFRRFCNAHDITPTKLIFGSGLGIPYYEQDRPLDLSAVAQRVNPPLDALRAEQRFARTDFVLETGRYLVGEAGVYLTRIISAKHSRGTEIRICDGGMNHHLGAAGHLGTPIHRNYRMFKLGAQSERPTQNYDLFGPLCTSIDMLAHGVALPAVDVGDVIGIHCSGAYGPTASPSHFISHPPAREILVETVSGETRIEDVSI